MSSKYPDDPFLTLSSPDFHAKHPPLVKLTRDEKIGNLSNPAVLFYVNPKALSTPPRPCGKVLWTTMWRMWKSISFQQLFGPFEDPLPAVENSPAATSLFPAAEKRNRITSPPAGHANRDFFIE